MYLTEIADLKLKFLIVVYLLLGLGSCYTNSSKIKEGIIARPQVIADTLKADLLVDGSVEKMVSLNHSRLLNIKGDLKSFILYVNNLDDKNLCSIPFALDYINTCISKADSSIQDSVFLIFNLKFYSVANTLTGNLDTLYKTVISDMDRGSSTNAARAFKNNLRLCGIGLFSTEGNYYADVEPDYFYDNFKDRVSPATKEFLSIRKKELKEGFSEDAGMLISFDSLYNRVKTWDKFITTYPGCLYYDEANNFYATYLETLMTGMDNSRIFEGDNNTLSPEIKSLYQKIISEKPDNRTSRLIASYYDLLAKENFIESDKIDSFLNQNNLSSMLGVEPHLR